MKKFLWGIVATLCLLYGIGYIVLAVFYTVGTVALSHPHYELVRENQALTAGFFWCVSVLSFMCLFLIIRSGELKEEIK